MQVNSGHIGVNHVRDLKGVLAREKAAIGALITLREPTKPMLTEAAAAGFYESEQFSGPLSSPSCHPKRSEGSLHFDCPMPGFFASLRMTTAGKKLEYPAHRVEAFAKAERKSKHQRKELL